MIFNVYSVMVNLAQNNVTSSQFRTEMSFVQQSLLWDIIITITYICIPIKSHFALPFIGQKYYYHMVLLCLWVFLNIIQKQLKFSKLKSGWNWEQCEAQPINFISFYAIF